MFVPNPVAFTLFGMDVKWYGIILSLAFLVGSALMYYRGKFHNIPGDSILDILIVAIPSGIIGARLYYVVFQWNFYAENLLQIFNLRGGGLAIHGGILGGIIGAYFVCRHKKISFLDGLDMTVPALALAQSIGRWGNYFNSEAHGYKTDLPWAITIMGEKVHPTFLYESIWCFCLFIALLYVDNHRKFLGQVTLLYGIFYSIERFWVEGLRTDSLMLGNFRQAQILSISLIITSLFLYIYSSRKEKISLDHD